MPNKKLIVSLFHIPKLTVAYPIHVLESYRGKEEILNHNITPIRYMGFTRKSPFFRALFRSSDVYSSIFHGNFWASSFLKIQRKWSASFNYFK
jgi:hypothetical protein